MIALCIIFTGNEECAAVGTVKITCVCEHDCSGYEYHFKRVTWTESSGNMNQHNKHWKLRNEWPRQVCVHVFSWWGCIFPGGKNMLQFLLISAHGMVPCNGVSKHIAIHQGVADIT